MKAKRIFGPFATASLLGIISDTVGCVSAIEAQQQAQQQAQHHDNMEEAGSVPTSKHQSPHVDSYPDASPLLFRLRRYLMPIAWGPENATLVTEDADIPPVEEEEEEVTNTPPQILPPVKNPPILDRLQQPKNESPADNVKEEDRQDNLYDDFSYPSAGMSYITSMSYDLDGKSTKTKSSKETKSSKKEKPSKKTGSPTHSSTEQPSSKSGKKSTKTPKSYTPTKAPKTYTSTKAPKDSKSTSAPSSSDSSKSNKKATKRDQIYNGNYIRLVEYRKSCTSQRGCLRDTTGPNQDAYCQGGMDVIHEFEVQEWGLVRMHVDVTWDFSRRSHECGSMKASSPTHLQGLGWLPVTFSNSYICFKDDIRRIPQTPNLNELTFNGLIELEVVETEERFEAHLLSGVVCEMYSEEEEYLDSLSLAIVALIPGYSLRAQFELDERSFEIRQGLSGAPPLTLQEDSSWNSHRWDYILKPDLEIMNIEI